VYEAGIASTVYALDGPGSNPIGGRDCPRSSRLALRPTQPTIKWVGSFPGVKRPGRGFEHPPSSSAEAVPLLPSGPSWSIYRPTFISFSIVSTLWTGRLKNGDPSLPKHLPI